MVWTKSSGSLVIWGDDTGIANSSMIDTGMRHIGFRFALR
jgi:hypothetical protein